MPGPNCDTAPGGVNLGLFETFPSVEVFSVFIAVHALGLGGLLKINYLHLKLFSPYESKLLPLMP